MSFITLGQENGQDIQLYYKDWGKGPAIVFSHGWPLSADAWEDQMLFLASKGYRCIAHDRRGFGRSSQTWHGNTMDGYADDLLKLVETLDLENVVHVGHSMGGGEVARYLDRHGEKRVAKAVFIGAVPPLMLQTEKNPEGIPMQVFDDMRGQILKDRPQFFQDLAPAFYGANQKGAMVSEGLKRSFWRQSMQAGIRGVYECVQQFSESDFTEGLKKIEAPTLIIHGDADDIVPMEITALKASKLIKNSELKIYKGASHGLCSTHKDQINADLLRFIEEA